MRELTTNAQFLRYCEDEYLSEIILRSMKPVPVPGAKPPSTVTFEWGLTVGSKLQMFTVKAFGVTRWSLDGEWDKHAVVELDLNKTRKGISFRQTVPGTLQLACAKLTIERGALKRYTSPPEIDPETFLVWGKKPVTWNQLRAWLGVPADHVHYDQTGDVLTLLDPSTFDQVITSPYIVPTRIQAATTKKTGAPWMVVMWMLAAGSTGHYLSVHRGTCDDAAWARAVRLPEHIGPSHVLSRTVKCTSATWIAKWAKRAARPG